MSRPFLLGFAVFFLGQFVAPVGRQEPAPQPIRYNHAKHLAAGLTCTDCHTGAQSEEHATLPALAVCIGCHAAPLTKSPEEAKLRALADAGGELNWTQVTRVPPHVYFSHRRHTAIAGISCAACHGPMEQVTAPPERPFRNWVMQTCLDCHRQKGAGTDCNDCHR